MELNIKLELVQKDLKMKQIIASSIINNFSNLTNSMNLKM